MRRPWRRDHVTGALESAIPHLDDRKHGLSKTFYENTGKLKIEIPFVHGRVDSPVRACFESGGVQTEAYYSDVVITGTAKTCYESSGLQTGQTFVNNKVEGLAKE